MKGRIPLQAILILAHTAPDHVITLSKLLHKRFEVYIHFDKKATLSPEHLKEMEKLGIYCFQEINVKWGGWSIGAAAEFLMREAMKNPEITHIHVISGQDWPTKNIDEMYDFYENNSNLYLECYKAKGVTKSGQPIILWQQYYYNFDKINRRTAFGKIYHRIIMFLQKIARIDKFKKLGVDLEIYHGANWMDLPRDAVEYLLDYFDNHPNVQQMFKTGFCPDEFWVQTILYNSPFKERIKQDIHRYMIWQQRFNSYPAILNEDDFNEIGEGDYHFCRKTVPGISDKLIEMLNEKLQ